MTWDAALIAVSAVGAGVDFLFVFLSFTCRLAPQTEPHDAVSIAFNPYLRGFPFFLPFRSECSLTLNS